MGAIPDGWAVETSKEDLNATTNLGGGKERREKVSSQGCPIDLVFDLIISHRNFVSFDSCTANGARFPPETPRSRFDECRLQGLGRVGERKEDEDTDG